MRCHQVFNAKGNLNFHHLVENGVPTLQIFAIQKVKIKGLFHELLV